MKARLIKQSGYEKYAVEVYLENHEEDLQNSLTLWHRLGQQGSNPLYRIWTVDADHTEWHKTEDEAISYYRKYKEAREEVEKEREKNKIVVLREL